MAVFERLHMPTLTGATEWLDSEPLGADELRGRVVLVNFWTLTCISWLRQEPYVRAWSQAYRDDGLVVIGVHTPEVHHRCITGTALGGLPQNCGLTQNRVVEQNLPTRRLVGEESGLQAC
jgi:thiol-disulfide isomerase/thioredoxin